jgi:hypothetical protein
MSVPENDHPLHRIGVERLEVHVTFDQRRGYIAVGEGLPIITALSLASLRRQIDARLAKRVIPKLELDNAARQERDARRHGAAQKV